MGSVVGVRVLAFVLAASILEPDGEIVYFNLIDKFRGIRKGRNA